MGSCVSSEAEEISFHPVVKGHHISLDGCMHRAERWKSFHHGLLFSNRPLRCQEKLWVRVLQDAPQWNGALRLGFTSVDPDTIDPSRLPPFACPDLTRLNGFWAVAIPEDLCFPSNLISFWVNKKGQALCQGMEDRLPTVLFSGLPRKKLLWAMLDVYGQTKAIQLLNSKRGKLPEPCNCQPNKASQIQMAVSNHGNGTSDSTSQIQMAVSNHGNGTSDSTSQIQTSVSNHGNGTSDSTSQIQTSVSNHGNGTSDSTSQIQTAVSNPGNGTSDSGSPCLCAEDSNCVSYLKNLNVCLFLEDEPYCVICQDDLADTQLLPCCHASFCKSCALKVQSQSARCPLCRQDIIHIQSIEAV
ncbi:E3 ubiquitin-protein ligase NEURL3 [Spea bombifrons]|uniref:E3 ubiquitin-protein ligase NEURL3 n=1 Tax=Spea bombifrons TaxID=233779 RepID=UPI002349CC81|nr:E3 ubiquitin-protein ligase NEURL3 [Spea bombifrons]